MFRKIQIPKVTLKQSLGKYKTNAHKCMQTDKNHKKKHGLQSRGTSIKYEYRKEKGKKCPQRRKETKLN